jgi:hypothetical protein
MFKGDILKVMTSEVRLSYVHIDQPYAQEGASEAKYSATLLLPKTDVAVYQEIMQAIEAAKQEGVRGPWKGACPPNPAITVYDGDGVRECSGEPYGAECKGCWVISAKSKWKPQVVHQSNVKCVLPDGSVKSGDYGRVVINFYPYDSNGNRGIAGSLGNIMITREGEALGGQTSAADDFADCGSAGYSAPAQGYTQSQYNQAPPQNYNQPQYNQAPPQNYNQPQYNQAPPQNYNQPQYNQAPPQNYAQPQYNQAPYDPNAFDPNAYMSGNYGA